MDQSLDNPSLVLFIKLNLFSLDLKLIFIIIVFQEARQKMQVMACKGEGITERNWNDVQECLAPGNKPVIRLFWMI
jgi:hypothetical protein